MILHAVSAVSETLLESYDMVAGLDVGDAFADRFNDTSSFVSENDGEGTLGIFAREGVCVCRGS